MDSKAYKRYTKFLISTFDKYSSTYINEFTSNTSEKLKLQSLVNSWNIKKGSLTLEVGGGTGDLSPFLLNKIGLKGLLVFIDISPKMVERAKDKLKKYKNVKYFSGDIHVFSYEQKFDSIVIFNTFPHFFDKKAAFTNCYKLLRKGGSLIISHNSSRWSIVGRHKKRSVSFDITDFPDDLFVYNTLVNIGYKLKVFENNEGYDYYLVIAEK